MLWSEIEQVIVSEVERLTCLTDRVFWVHQAGTLWEDTLFVELSLVSLVVVGRDEVRYSASADGTALVPRVYGLRNLNVQVKIDSMRQNFSNHAFAVASPLHASLSRCPDVDEAFARAELVIANIGNITNVDYMDSYERMRSAAIFEMVIHTHEGVTCSSIPTVDQIAYTSDIDDVAGSDVADTTVVVTTS